MAYPAVILGTTRNKLAMQGAAVATEIFRQRGALAAPTRGKGKRKATP